MGDANRRGSKKEREAQALLRDQEIALEQWKAEQERLAKETPEERKARHDAQRLLTTMLGFSAGSSL